MSARASSATSPRAEPAEIGPAPSAACDIRSYAHTLAPIPHAHPAMRRHWTVGAAREGDSGRAKADGRERLPGPEEGGCEAQGDDTKDHLSAAQLCGVGARAQLDEGGFGDSPPRHIPLLPPRRMSPHPVSHPPLPSAPSSSIPTAQTSARSAHAHARAHAHLGSCRIASPRLASPRLASPRLASPRLASPRIASHRAASCRVAFASAEGGDPAQDGGGLGGIHEAHRAQGRDRRRRRLPWPRLAPACRHGQEAATAAVGQSGPDRRRQQQQRPSGEP